VNCIPCGNGTVIAGFVCVTLISLIGVGLYVSLTVSEREYLHFSSSVYVVVILWLLGEKKFAVITYLL